MNIIQLEDNLKSLPDSNLENEMTNPSGMFPQYLVMSEIQRRKDMREDYAGRMAANEKTPPLPSMREQMLMGINQPQPPVQDSGIAGLLPAQPQGAPIPPAMSASPDVMPMYGGGVVGMQSGTGVPDLFGLTTDELKAAGLYDDPNTPEDERITDYEKTIMDYYKTLQEEQPERIEQQRKFGEGLNLMRTGLVLGTAATFEDLNKGLEKTINSIDASNRAISKKEDDLKKSKLEEAKAMAGIDAVRDKKLIDLSKLKTERESKAATADYMRGLGSKPSTIEQIASDIVERDKNSQTLPIYDETVDEKGNKIKVINNQKLLEFANQYQQSIGAAGIRQETSLRETFVNEVNEKMADVNTTIEIFEMVKNEGISIEDATQRIRLKTEANIAKQLGIPIDTKYSGGVVGKSAQSFNDVVKTINA
tara:strand:- start:2190 stop:3452 length:1263 start_codon:yes stop_codon:yes gene_type:complete